MTRLPDVTTELYHEQIVETRSVGEAHRLATELRARNVYAFIDLGYSRQHAIDLAEGSVLIDGLKVHVRHGMLYPGKER